MNFKELKGTIIVSIYDKISNFPHEGEIRSLSSKESKSSETFIIR